MRARAVDIWKWSEFVVMCVCDLMRVVAKCVRFELYVFDFDEMWRNMCGNRARNQRDECVLLKSNTLFETNEDKVIWKLKHFYLAQKFCICILHFLEVIYVCTMQCNNLYVFCTLQFMMFNRVRRVDLQNSAWFTHSWWCLALAKFVAMTTHGCQSSGLSRRSVWDRLNVIIVVFRALESFSYISRFFLIFVLFCFVILFCFVFDLQVVSQDSHSLLSAHYRLDSHPRISSLHEVLVCNRHMYLVFPRSHGDLHSHVRTRKRLRESEAKKMFRQIAETVQVCHRNGIVLRDLKLRKFVFADEER